MKKENTEDLEDYANQLYQVMHVIMSAGFCRDEAFVLLTMFLDKKLNPN